MHAFAIDGLPLTEADGSPLYLIQIVIPSDRRNLKDNNPGKQPPLIASEQVSSIRSQPVTLD